VGLGYYGAKQQADRFLIAGEKRRKAMHLLMQDVRTAYWRAASAQLLKADVQKTIALAEEAMTDSRKASSERVRNPLEPLRYQRQLLENLRLLENINQELSSAQVDLAALINAPVGQIIQIATTELKNIDDEVTKVSVDKLEEVALQNNPDLREQHYNARIAREEQVRAAEIARERNIREAEITKERDLEVAEQERQIIIQQKSEEESRARASADLARAEARLALADGADKAQARMLLRSALDQAQAQGALLPALRVATDLARLLAEGGAPDRARTLLAPAIAALPATEGPLADLAAARTLADTLS
jgi:hypothetical protein